MYFLSEYCIYCQFLGLINFDINKSIKMTSYFLYITSKLPPSTSSSSHLLAHGLIFGTNYYYKTVVLIYKPRAKFRDSLVQSVPGEQKLKTAEFQCIPTHRPLPRKHTSYMCTHFLHTLRERWVPKY